MHDTLMAAPLTCNAVAVRLVAVIDSSHRSEHRQIMQAKVSFYGTPAYKQSATSLQVRLSKHGAMFASLLSTAWDGVFGKTTLLHLLMTMGRKGQWQS